MLSAQRPEPRVQLLPGEHLIWSGKPRNGLIFYKRDWLLIPFSFAWCGFAILWTFMAWNQGAPLFFMFWGAGFVAVGLFFSIGRFWFDAHVRSRQLYAVTSDRLLILTTSSTTSASLQNLPQLTVNEGKGGRGTIEFGSPQSFFGAGNALAFWVPALGRSQFTEIANVMKVYGMILKAQKESA